MEVASKSNTKGTMIYKTKYDIVAYMTAAILVVIGVVIWMLMK